MVFLYLLIIHAVMVGMCLGVLLPIPFSGISWGLSVSLLVGAFLIDSVQNVLYFPLVGGVLAVLAAAASLK